MTNNLQELPVISEELEVLSADELINLKFLLVEKISKFCQKLNINIENLSSSFIGDNLDVIINSNGHCVYKTTCTCHICEVKIPCIHNKYWQISHLEKHIKTHQTRKLEPEVVKELNQILETKP